MKKILITGENSYIGSSFETYLNKFQSDYTIDTISVRDTSWKSAKFEGYDVLFHVAGIAHQKETEENKSLYYSVNYELVKDIAEKAKKSKIKQMIFLSSMSVYGVNSGTIDENTPINPNTFYGDSKYKAEEYLRKMKSDEFKVVIVRPPMVYGPSCKGNYASLSKFSKITPFFPKIDNERSMIFIDNLSAIILDVIKRGYGGYCFPQNKEYVTTYEMVTHIKKLVGKKIIVNQSINSIIRLGIHKSNKMNKIFGDLKYSESLVYKSDDVNLVDFYDSIEITENTKNHIFN